jgi:hypothetical protein
MRNLMVMTVLLAACGGSGSVSIDNYPAAVRDAFCHYLTRCGDVESFATCRTANIGRTFVVSASERAGIDMSKIRYSAESAASCLDALANLSCDLTSQSSRTTPDACRQLVTGTLHDGDTCALDDECISEVCEVPACNMACCMGKCAGNAAPSLAKLGQPCDLSACVAGAFCDDTTLVCTALKPSGATCQFQQECGYGLACLNTCQALPTLGQACTVACRDDGTTCSPTSHTCIKVGLAGSTCTPSALISECSPLYPCDQTGHCTAGIALGQPCTQGDLCTGDRAFCDIATGQAAGMCALPKPDGSACTRDSACDSVFCDPVALKCAPDPVCI